MAVLLEKQRREKNLPLLEVVNEALRRGLTEGQRTPPKKRFETPTGNLGRLLIPSIDCHGEVLDFLEAQGRKQTHQ